MRGIPRMPNVVIVFITSKAHYEFVEAQNIWTFGAKYVILQLIQCTLILHISHGLCSR
ncbi:4077a939-4625-4455-9bbf-1861cad74f76 [Sclerotinia trifoliorum]|uniref:4077a939-4625-4455-9bbf-1861cad74f76 n=1 Tax=Sclerotinia trifoliorum TaxID=28548 RepID=A0A8H2ZS24_9HELO|nr:4077a939-4625-4455-9bbf-1861cad74f76 [Sclerotinia trifoliorum]